MCIGVHVSGRGVINTQRSAHHGYIHTSEAQCPIRFFRTRRQKRGAGITPPRHRHLGPSGFAVADIAVAMPCTHGPTPRPWPLPASSSPPRTHRGGRGHWHHPLAARLHRHRRRLGHRRRRRHRRRRLYRHRGGRGCWHPLAACLHRHRRAPLCAAGCHLEHVHTMR